MIKPCQMWMKVQTTKTGAPSSRKDAEKAQTKCQKDMSQERIQKQIQRIIRHIAIVILQEGDNKYKEEAYKEGEVLRETREQVDISVLDIDYPK